jgi:hypothetical protein
MRKVISLTYLEVQENYARLREILPHWNGKMVPTDILRISHVVGIKIL